MAWMDNIKTWTRLPVEDLIRMAEGNRFVVVGDFKVPGDVAGQLDPHAVDVLTQYGLRQHVTGPTHISGNT